MGSVGENTAGKSFSTLSVKQKRKRLEMFKQSLDGRFKHYTVGDYDVYNTGGQFAAYKFNGLTDEQISKWTNESYAAVLYEKTLKAIKAQLGR